MSWRSQGHTKQVHNISQKIVVFSTTGICKLCPGDFQAILFWFDIVPNFHLFFFRCPGDRKDKKYLVHNMSLNLLFFSTICKLCPGDFQAILFWSDIVPKFLLFFFRCPGDRKDIQSKCTIFHQNLLFFSTICKLCPGDFQAILFWFDIVPESNLIFLRMSWRSQGHAKQVHNISQKFVVFSTICKLLPGDFQAILFWCDIVPKFNLIFFSDVLAIART